MSDYEQHRQCSQQQDGGERVQRSAKHHGLSCNIGVSGSSAAMRMYLMMLSSSHCVVAVTRGGVPATTTTMHAARSSSSSRHTKPQRARATKNAPKRARRRTLARRDALEGQQRQQQLLAQHLSSTHSFVALPLEAMCGDPYDEQHSSADDAQQQPHPQSLPPIKVSTMGGGRVSRVTADS